MIITVQSLTDGGVAHAAVLSGPATVHAASVAGPAVILSDAAAAQSGLQAEFVDVDGVDTLVLYGINDIDEELRVQVNPKADKAKR